MTVLAPSGVPGIPGSSSRRAPIGAGTLYGGRSVSRDSTFDFENRHGEQPLSKGTLLRALHTEKSLAANWLLTPPSLHLRTRGGDHPKHCALPRLPREDILWPYPDPAVTVHAVHCNGLHPSLDPGEHTIVWMMTCAPLTFPEDLKLLLKKGLAKLCPQGIVPRD